VIPPDTRTPTAAQEWRTHGPMVMAAMIGVSFGTVPTASLGLFMDPLQQEFGWTRTEISLALTIFAVFALPLGPLGGMLVDRFGARRIAIPGLALSGAAFASLSLLTGSYLQWLLTWVLYTCASVGTRTLVWSSAISSAFTTSRGLAIAAILCGSALATSLAPSVTHWLIENHGWRGGYLGLGLGWAGLALLLVVLFFRDRSKTRAPAPSTGAPAPVQRLPGLTVKQAVRKPVLYRIAFAMFLQSLMGAAVMVHLVPMLGADGLSRAEAAGIAVFLGAGSLIGKLATGWLIDRFTGSIIPFASYAGPAVGYFLLLQASGAAWLLAIAVFINGYCAGASLQLATYLTTRYAGMRSFGTIFGLISSFMALAAGVGPPLAGAIFDRTGSYALLLGSGIPIALLAGLTMTRLGPYPRFDSPAGTGEQ